jgi:hypothetical protein
MLNFCSNMIVYNAKENNSKKRDNKENMHIIAGPLNHCRHSFPIIVTTSVKGSVSIPYGPENPAKERPHRVAGRTS